MALDDLETLTTQTFGLGRAVNSHSGAGTTNTRPAADVLHAPLGLLAKFADGAREVVANGGKLWARKKEDEEVS